MDGDHSDWCSSEKLNHRRKDHQNILNWHRKHSAETWKLGQRHIQLAPETKFRDTKPGPKTRSGTEILSYDVDDVSILTNEVMENGNVQMQLNDVIVDDVRTRPMILHDAMFWSRPTKPQKMMLRYQSTMLNINYATDDDDALILINDVTHEDDVSILINDATDDDNVSIT